MAKKAVGKMKATKKKRSATSATRRTPRTRSEHGSPKKTVKKTPATKKGGSDGPRSRLSRSDLDHFRQLLLELRDELVGDYNSLSDRALNNSSQEASGNLSKMPIHMADVGTDTFNQEMDVQLLEGESRKLKRINEALTRIDEGTYGICLHSGRPIPKARLEAIPYARYTVQAQEELERRGELVD